MSATKKTVFRGDLKLNQTLSSGTGDPVLTRDATTKEIGEISSIDLSAYLSNTLTSGRIFIGNSSNVATERQATGAISISNTGVVSLANNIVTNANINSAAAIAYSKLNLTASITDGDIATAAQITRSKLADGTANRLVVNNGAGVISELAAITGSKILLSSASGLPIAADTATYPSLTELSYVKGTTSAIQTQFSNKLSFSSGITPAEGDLIQFTGGNWVNLGVGANGEVLTSDGTNPVWASGVSNGLPTGGTADQYLTKIDGTDYNTQWSTLTISKVTDITASAAEINLLDGVTASTTELNYVDGVTAPIQTQFGDKQNRALPQNAIWVGNVSNVAAAVPNGNNGDVLTIVGTTPTWQPPGAGSGTVTSVDFTAPSEFVVSGVPINTTGTITLDWDTQAANLVFAGPSTGADDVPTFRSLVKEDMTINTGVLLGRTTASTGAIEEITVSAPLSLSAGTLSMGAGSALTKVDDTNVTLSLGGSPTTALLAATSLTLGWTGTLAAARLNANVVQSVVNDTNITGSIATQALTLGWTGTLAVTRGGTGFNTATQGDIIYADGANSFDKLPKSTSATRYLSNTGASNNPAWAQINLANGVTGDLPFANLTQIAGLSILGVTGTSTADVAAITGTANQVLRVNSAGTSLAFGTVAVAGGGTGLTTLGGTNRILYTTTTDNISSLVTANSSILVTDGSGIPSWSTTLPSGVTGAFWALTGTSTRTGNTTITGTTDLTIQTTGGGSAPITIQTGGNSQLILQSGIALSLGRTSSTIGTASNIVAIAGSYSQVGTGGTGSFISIPTNITQTTGTSGTHNYRAVSVTGTYNMTSAGAGYVAGFLYDPTITALTNISNYSFVSSSGLAGFGTLTPTARLQAKGVGTTTGELFRLDDSASTNRLLVLDNGLTTFSSAIQLAITSVSADTTLDQSHHTVKVDASGANRTITLPAASGKTGRIYIIKKTDNSANTVTIDGNASETIDGATTKVINTQYAGYAIQCDGSNWVIVAAF